jgi:predicted nucleic acid-binding Zn ribbon protein
VSTSEWEPRPGDGGPRPVGSSLDAVARHLGVVSASALTGIFTAWAELVGESVAAHSVPAALRAGRLTVSVDDPAWATQLRWLAPELVERLVERLGSGVVTDLDLRVRPPQ